MLSSFWEPSGHLLSLVQSVRSNSVYVLGLEAVHEFHSLGDKYRCRGKWKAAAINWVEVYGSVQMGWAYSYGLVHSQKWLGIWWDTGPENASVPYPPKHPPPELTDRHMLMHSGLTLHQTKIPFVIETGQDQVWSLQEYLPANMQGTPWNPWRSMSSFVLFGDLTITRWINTQLVSRQAPALTYSANKAPIPFVFCLSEPAHW